MIPSTWSKRAVAVFIAVGLALWLNPELRALLLLADALGLELLVVLLLTQVRGVWPLLRASAAQVPAALCPRLGAGVLELGRWAVGLLGSRPSVALPAQMAHALLCTMRCRRLREHCPP